MRNILFLLPSSATGGGVQKATSLITKALDTDEGFSVTVASLFDYDKRKYNYGEHTRHLKGTLEQNNNIRKVFFRAKKTCKQLLSKSDFDTIVVEGLGIVPLLPFKLLKDKNVKLVIRDHSGYSNYTKYGLSWIGLKITIKYANTFIVLSNDIKAEYLSLFPKLKSIIKVIPNTIDPDVVREPYNLDSKKICFVGRLSEGKGPHLLIEAFSKLVTNEKFSDWKLDIYGTGPMMDKLRSLVDNSEVSGNVFFKGHHNDIINLYKEYAFLVVPSRYESFGLVILEALTVGIPVISFDCNYGPRTMISHMQNGLLVENGNVDELKKAIELLISNKEIRSELAGGYNRKTSAFDYFKVIENWKKVL